MEQATGGAAAATQPSQPGADAVAAAVDMHSTPTSPDGARSALEVLRMQRIQGNVTEHDYLARSDYLHRVAAGEQGAAWEDPKGVTLEQKLERQYDTQMEAPASAGAYGQLPAMAKNEEMAQGLDTAVRTAFMKTGIPAHLGAPLIEAVNRVSLKVNANDEQAQEMLKQSTANALRTHWGNEFQGRFDAIADLVCELGEAHPIVGEIIDRAPWLIFGDEAAMDYLGRIAQHRAKLGGGH